MKKVMNFSEFVLKASLYIVVNGLKLKPNGAPKPDSLATSG